MDEHIKKIAQVISHWVIKHDGPTKPQASSYNDAEVIYNFIRQNFDFVRGKSANMSCSTNLFQWIIQTKKGTNPRKISFEDIKIIYSIIQEKITHDFFCGTHEKNGLDCYNYLSYNIDYFEYEKNIKKMF